MKSTSTLNRQILDEASIWFVDFRVGDVDAEARARFDEWLRRSPEHIRAYMEISRTYVELPAVLADSALGVQQLIAAASAAEGSNVVTPDEFARTDSADSALGHGGISGVASARTPRPGRGSLRFAATVTGVVILLAGALGTWWLLTRNVYTTDIGERRTLTLADGSTVDLNARSKVWIRFSKSERDVELLQGQALFEVAKNPARPFVVKAGGTQVRAVGTSFDVNRHAAETLVTVLEGRVAVVPDASQIQSAVTSGPGPAISPRDSGTASPSIVYVSAGEQATVALYGVSVRPRSDVSAAVAWTQHRLVFDGSRLADVVDDFNRYNRRRLLIEDATLEDFHVSGVYSSTDPASLIRFLEAQPNIEVVESEEGVRIRRK